jgi:ribosomal protein S18 acetylase RimI-like enzyme
MRIRIEVSDDARAVLDAGEAFLNRAPAGHNLLLTILRERADHAEPGRYWMLFADDKFSGLALQSPLTSPAVLTEVPPGCIEGLVNAIAAERPDLPGVFGSAVTASLFAGCWAEKRRLPVSPVEALRLYRLTILQAPPPAPGSLRMATDADFELVLEWLKGFREDTGSTVAPPDTMRRRIRAGMVWIWEDGKPVSIAALTIPLVQTVRVYFVYTPHTFRCRGYAASCVSAVSRTALDAGAAQCVLYTQLSNPQSNAIYRRLGYEPIQELLRYRFS